MENVCTSCGAPVRPGLIECEFCERPVSAEAAKTAIPCKQCRALNVETAQQCIKCKDWLVVQCVFCQHVSRHDAPACAHCREPFLGAAERKAARDAQLRNQQLMNTAVAVAPLAGSLLGGLAGAFLGSSSGSSSSSSEHHHSMGESLFGGSDESSSSGESFGDAIGGLFDDDDNTRG